MNDESLIQILQQFWGKYKKETPTRLKIMDAFIFYCLILIGIQTVYLILVGDFPRNSLISGVFAPLGSLVITICFRKQINPETRYMQISDERAFWEYLAAMVILYLTVVNFVG